MTSKVYPVKPSLIFLFIWGVFHWGDKRFGDDWPARHRSRPNEVVSIPEDFRSGEAGGSKTIRSGLVLPWDQTPDRSDLKNNTGCVQSFGPESDRANRLRNVYHNHSNSTCPMSAVPS